MKFLGLVLRTNYLYKGWPILINLCHICWYEYLPLRCDSLVKLRWIILGRSVFILILHQSCESPNEAPDLVTYHPGILMFLSYRSTHNTVTWGIFEQIWSSTCSRPKTSKDIGTGVIRILAIGSSFCKGIFFKNKVSKKENINLMFLLLKINYLYGLQRFDTQKLVQKRNCWHRQLDYLHSSRTWDLKHKGKVWTKISAHSQKLANSKKSTLFVQFSWNLGKLIASWGNYFYQVSWGLDKICGSLING